MKILIVSNEFLAPDLALRLKNEGNTVLLALKDDAGILDGTITRVPFDDRAKYFSKVDLVFYDDTDFGDEPVETRKIVPTLGGSKTIDKMEKDRIFGIKLAKSVGIKVPDFHELKSFDEARKFIVDNPGRWVMKQQGELDNIKGLNFVSKMDDSKDLVDHINWLESIWVEGMPFEFIFQEFVDGHEMAVGAYWNGEEFMKDADGDEVCEQNWEHKALFPGDLGESTGEQYTVMQYLKAKDSKLFSETLDKCRDLLKKVNFRGNVDINCKINEDGVYFLEWTNRCGVPATSAQIAIHETPWNEFLMAVADSKQCDFEYRCDFTIVSWLYSKPFPTNIHQGFKDIIIKKFENSSNLDDMKNLLDFRLLSPRGIVVNFKEKLTKEELNNIHFDGVAFKDGKLKIANDGGYVVTVTGSAETPKLAGEKVEKLLKKIVVPRGFWRNDFEKSHYEKSKEDLCKWGYLEEVKEDEVNNIKKELNVILG